jgi:DNA topoisomerase IA
MILIIAEKPDAAMRIAQALADKKPEKKISKYEVNYYEFKRKGKKHIVIAAVGHLFNLKQSDKGWDHHSRQENNLNSQKNISEQLNG